jgi:hypothetical protein
MAGGDLGLISRVHGRNKWADAVNTLMNLWVLQNMGNFFD